MITSTMQDDVPLTINAITRHTAAVHGEVELAAFDGEQVRRTPYAVVLDRALRLAGALRAAGVASRRIIPASASAWPPPAGTRRIRP